MLKFARLAEQHLVARCRSGSLPPRFAAGIRSFAQVRTVAVAECSSAGQASRVRSLGGHRGALDFQLDAQAAETGALSEELFACAYAASFENALRHCAAESGSELGESNVKASVASQKVPGSSLRVLHLRIEVEFDAGISGKVARALTEQAQEACPHTRNFAAGGAAVEVNSTTKVVQVAQPVKAATQPEAATRPAASASAAEQADPEIPSALEQEEPEALQNNKVLIVGRREDLLNAMLRDCAGMGLENHGVLTNAEAESLLGQHQFVACAIAFRYGDREGQDIDALRALLEARGVPAMNMPPGTKNVRNALQRLGMDAPRDERFAGSNEGQDGGIL